MRIARFSRSGDIAYGLVQGDGDELADLSLAPLAGHPLFDPTLTGEVVPLTSVRLLAPTQPINVVCIGKNYADHVAEMKDLTGPPPGDNPVVFLKPATSVVGPGDPVRLPRDSTRVDHEAELAVVIGARGARNVSPEQALSSVFGYTIGNDVSERDMQKSDGQWTRAKGFDSFCPIGPWIETDVAGLGLDPADLEVTCDVDGERRQQGRTSQLIFDVPTLISYISQVMTLLPGDVVLTGTPSGVGPIRPGQRVDVSVQGLGTLSNTVTAADAVSTAGGAR